MSTANESKEEGLRKRRERTVVSVEGRTGMPARVICIAGGFWEPSANHQKKKKRRKIFLVLSPDPFSPVSLMTVLTFSWVYCLRYPCLELYVIIWPSFDQRYMSGALYATTEKCYQGSSFPSHSPQPTALPGIQMWQLELWRSCWVRGRAANPGGSRAESWNLPTFLMCL